MTVIQNVGNRQSHQSYAGTDTTPAGTNATTVAAARGTSPATGGTSPKQLALMQQQLDEQRKSVGTFASHNQTPPFPAFDSTAKLWKDYLLRFKTFVSANSVTDDKLALVFLTNQTSDTYKFINNYASQQDTPTTADNMKFSDIA